MEKNKINNKNKKITINIPRKVFLDMEEIINDKNSIYSNRTDYIKKAIIEKNNKEKKS